MALFLVVDCWNLATQVRFLSVWQRCSVFPGSQLQRHHFVVCFGLRLDSTPVAASWTRDWYLNRFQLLGYFQPPAIGHLYC